jgi:anti-anti-sigma factor
MRMCASPRIESLGPHDHACWTYGSDEEYRAGIASYVGAGLVREERVVVLSARDRPPADHLAAAGIPVAAAVHSGQLVLGIAEDEYLADGRFDADDRLRRLAVAHGAALDDGFTGLRVAAEVSWLLDHPSALDTWPAYEVRADVLAAAMQVTGVCAYDGRRWPDHELALLESLHGVTVRAGSPPPERATGFHLYGQRDGSIRLHGELDATHGEDVRLLLDAAAESSSAPVLDLAGLDFVDVAGARAIALACRAIVGRHGRATIRGASPVFRRVWALAEFDRAEPSIAVE